MPNGKGSLDCSYCIHFDEPDGYPGGWGEERFCDFHQTTVPSTRLGNTNRICANFEPNQAYNRDSHSPEFFPLARRFAWFGIDMKPGVLYEFGYNSPNEVSISTTLRIPDYQNNTWKKVGE